MHHSRVHIADWQPSPVFSPEDLMVENETRQSLHEHLLQALNLLPARQREAVYLRYYEELSYKEVASIMGVNYQSVVNLLFKAMTALRKKEPIRKLTTLLHWMIGGISAAYLMNFL